MWPIYAWQEVGQMFSPTLLVEGGVHQLIREALLPLGKRMRRRRRDSHTCAPPPPSLASSRRARRGLRESRQADFFFATHEWYMNGCAEVEQSMNGCVEVEQS